METRLPGAWTSNQASFLQDMCPVPGLNDASPVTGLHAVVGRGCRQRHKRQAGGPADQQRSKDRAVMIINSILGTAV